MSAVGFPPFHKRYLSNVSEGFEESPPGDITDVSLQAIWESLDNGSLLTFKSLDLTCKDPVLAQLKETQVLLEEVKTPRKLSSTQSDNSTDLLPSKAVHQAQRLVIEEATKNTSLDKRHLVEQISSSLISDFVQCLGREFLEDLLSKVEGEKSQQEKEAKLAEYIFSAFRISYERFTLEDLLDTPNPLKPLFSEQNCQESLTLDPEYVEEAQYLILKEALINSCYFYQKTPKDYGIEDISTATPKQLAEIWKRLAEKDSCNLVNEFLSCNPKIEEYRKKIHSFDGFEKEDGLADLLYATFIDSHGDDFTLEELANPPTAFAQTFAPPLFSEDSSDRTTSWPSIENEEALSLSNKSTLLLYYP